jgi:hypothetical protein
VAEDCTPHSAAETGDEWSCRSEDRQQQANSGAGGGTLGSALQATARYYFQLGICSSRNFSFMTSPPFFGTLSASCL